MTLHHATAPRTRRSSQGPGDPKSSDTDKRDREEKPVAYARTGIPVYLLIDRNTCETLVYSEPDGDTYADLTRRAFGRTIDLPTPVGITLGTEPLKDWVR